MQPKPQYVKGIHAHEILLTCFHWAITYAEYILRILPYQPTRISRFHTQFALYVEPTLAAVIITLTLGRSRRRRHRLYFIYLLELLALVIRAAAHSGFAMTLHTSNINAGQRHMDATAAYFHLYFFSSPRIFDDIQISRRAGVLVTSLFSYSQPRIYKVFASFITLKSRYCLYACYEGHHRHAAVMYHARTLRRLSSHSIFKIISMCQISGQRINR